MLFCLPHRIFAVASTSLDIVCNTEKDRTRLHDRTAGEVTSKKNSTFTSVEACNHKQYHILLFTLYPIGILAGVRPCGIIVLLAELFRAESKSQVYAILHEYLRKHPCVLKNIGMRN